MKQLESKLQIECIKYFRYQYPKFIIFANANGGFRNVIEAKILKAQGVLSGVSDLQIIEPRKGFHGMFIEMKTGKNKKTPNQDWFLQAAHERGYKCAIIRSFDEFKNEVDSYFS